MAIRKFRTGQMSYAASTYVGTAGTIFYDEDTGALRLSDGVTPGGSLISYPIASSSQLGGIKLGPGVVLNGSNQIVINSTGLDFSFGDLASTIETYTNLTDYAVLQTININEDLILASNGTGGIHVVGEFRVHATNGGLTATLESTPAFEIKSDGQVKMLVPAIDSTEGGVSIVGNSTGAFVSPVNTGVMLHITGQYASPAIPSRVYNDAQNSFAAFVARRFNGTVTSPTAVLDGEEIMRISGTAHDGTGIPGVGNTRIVYKVLGNQTLTNHGGAIELWATPVNTTTLAKVATVDSVGITLESGKVLTGNVTGNVSGTAATVTTAAQPAITSVGTLSALTVSNTVNATNFKGAVRDGGVVTGTTLTLNFSSDHMVHCTFTDAFTVAFSNYAAGSTITLIATNTSAGDTDIITAGISSVRMQGDSTLTVTQQTTAIVTYYCVGTTVNDVYASAVYA